MMSLQKQTFRQVLSIYASVCGF